MKKVQYNRSRIRECRDIKGLTQKKVADLSKVSARTYQSAEAEEYINIKTANKINKTLGLNDEAYKSFKEPIEVTTKRSDSINPSYYRKGIETTDYIQSHSMNYMEGNIIKYVTRYKSKNDCVSLQLEDLKKAQWYLTKLIKEVEQEGHEG